MLAVILVHLAACTMTPIDPIIPTPQEPGSPNSYIFFDTEVSSTVVKKSDPLYYEEDLPKDAGTKFGALGYYGSTPLFTGYTDNIAEVYRQEKDAPFTYVNLATWLSLSAEHKFYAFYPYSLGVTPNNGNPYVNYTLPEKANMQDILVAYCDTARVSSVILPFKHALWALDVEVKITQTENPYNPTSNSTLSPSLTVKKVVLHLQNIPGSGKLYIKDRSGEVSVDDCVGRTYTVFESTDATPAKTIPYKNDKDETVNAVTFDPLLFLPTNVTLNDQTKVAYRLELTLANSWGNEYEFKYPATGYQPFGVTKFDAGKRYKLTVNKGNDPDFTIGWQIQSWGDPVNVPHTFQ